MASLKVVLELDNNGYIRSIKEADDATEKFSREAKKGIDQTNNSVKSLNTSASKLQDLLQKVQGLLIGGAFLGFATNALMAADRVNDLSDAFELNISKIYEIRQALKEAGGEYENVDKLIVTFYKSIDEAASGSDKAQQAFGKVGISLQDLAKLSPEDLFDRAARGLVGINDPATRSALAIDLFGKSMVGVSPSAFADELEKLRGKFVENEKATKEAARLIGEFEKSLNDLQLTFIKTFGPAIKLVADFANWVAKSEVAIQLLSVALLAIPGVAFGRLIGASISSASRGFSILLDKVKGVKKGVDEVGKSTINIGGKKLTEVGPNAGKGFNPMASAYIGSAVGGATAVGLGAAAMMTGGSEEEKAAKVGDELKKNVGRTIEQGKEAKKLNDELEKQRQAIENMADAYKNNVALAESKMALEGAMLGMTEEQKSLYKGVFEINQRANEQIAKLEEKRKEAKGANVALVDKEIQAVEQLRQREIAGFQILHERTQERKREEQAIKNIIAAMEEAEKFNQEMAQYAQQVDQARLAAWGQVDALQRGIDLAVEREQLEQSIVNLHTRDQATIKRLFDLEKQRNEEIRKIQNTKDLPFEDQERNIALINSSIDAEKQRVEKAAELRKKEQADFITGWRNAGEKYRNNLKTDAEYAAEIFNNITRSWEDAFVKFVMTGKLSFKDLANSVLQQMARMGSQQLFAGLFGDKSSGGGGIFGSIFSSIFGGFKAGGGPVSNNRAYMVGERGPELFVPRNAGNIVPNGALAGGGEMSMVTYNINATDAASFKTLLARDPEFLFAVTEQARKNLPQRSRR